MKKSVAEDQLASAVAAFEAYGNKAEAAKSLGLSRTTFCDRLDAAAKRGMVTMDLPSASKGRSLSDFRQEYDKDFIVPKKIEGALAEIGKDGWEYEVGFAKLAGISLADLGNYREKYAEYVVVIKRDGKRAWAGSPKTAATMRSMLT